MKRVTAKQDQGRIKIHGARVNNLKNISVEIPRDRLVVITGLSGSGKSSLAFDTLYAEGQRRYVESLSVYARQFVDKIGKPEVDYITGIPPAIAIKQRTAVRTPRSTVGTSTEIYDYLRMLYTRIGKTISPISGRVVTRHTVADVRRFVEQLPEGTRYQVNTPMQVPRERSLYEHLQILKSVGYSRIESSGEVLRIDDISEEQAEQMHPEELCIVVDRLVKHPPTDESFAAEVSRLGDAAEIAFFEGRGALQIIYFDADRKRHSEPFSDRFEADGILFEEPSDNFFSFNSPVGACPTCEGFSKVMGIDEDLVVPNKRLSLYDDTVACWRGAKMSEWKKYFIKASEKYNFPIHRPYNELTEEQRSLLWHGAPDLHGIDDFFKYLESKTYKMHYRIMLARYRGRTICPTCKGRRLKKEALYVHIAGKNIADLVEMPLSELQLFFQRVVPELDEHDRTVGGRILEELRHRIRLLCEIGLGYLTLDRLSATLSGGEAQRISLANSLGSGLVGSLYILDEPSIGLHSRDTHLLIEILQRLTSIGNSVVVVEHDEDIIRAAEHIIDVGPDAGRKGGEVVFEGDPNKLPKRRTKSHTVEYLTGRRQIPWPKKRATYSQILTIRGAYLHNLKGIDVTIPLGILSVVTGVSGSGKSTLVREICYEGLKRLLDNASIESIACQTIEGDLSAIRAVEYIDQNSIGKSTRSNPVTYVGAYDEIRKLMASQPLAKQLGFTPAYFSTNKEGGRCETCKGDGHITVEMQFMADIEIVCDECGGRRFSEDLLEVTFAGKNIYDILEMTVNQAMEFFEEHEEDFAECRRILEGIRVLREVGLGYIKLGQTSSSLSGGENQRVKLAYYLARRKAEPTLFIFDEPTTGLHIHDIRILMGALRSLIEMGHTILIVEHNMEVIKCADYVIDLGPEGGKAGGHLVYQGTPEGLMETPKSYTGHYLKKKYDEEHP